MREANRPVQRPAPVPQPAGLTESDAWSASFRVAGAIRMPSDLASKRSSRPTSQGGAGRVGPAGEATRS